VPLALAIVALFSQWIPARWHSSDPKSLELLTGTPVNCLLLERAQWDAKFVSAAQAHRIAVLGVVHPGEQAGADALAAGQRKLNGIVLEGAIDSVSRDAVRAASARSGQPIIELTDRRGIRLDSDDPILGTWQALWPGLEIEHNGKVIAGPSAAPWVNTNAGFLRFVRASTDAAIWIGVQPPSGYVFPVERYTEAIGDAALAGARWIVAIDADFEKRLYAREAGAVSDWRRIMHYASYLEQHREWQHYRPYSTLAVVQGVSSGGLLSGSLLDMIASQRTPVRVIPTRKLDAERLRGIHVLLNVDPGALSPAQKAVVEEFKRNGGQVLDPPAQWHFPATSNDQIVLTRRQLDQMQDLWEVTYNATVRKNFGTRTFNTTGMQSSVLLAPDRKSIIIHLVNYTESPVEAITVQALGSWKRATLYSPDEPARDLPVYPVKDGTGVDIEKMGVIATVKLE
jgi:hypothetical protein